MRPLPSITDLTATAGHCTPPSPLSTAEQCPLDRIQYHVEILAHILGEEPQHEIAILLEQSVLVAIPAIGIRTFQVLRAVQLNGHTRISAQQIDFQSTPIVEWNRQFDIQTETPRGCRQRLQPAIQESLRRASRTIGAFGIRRKDPY